MTTEELIERLPLWLESKELVDMPYTTLDPETGIITVTLRLKYKSDPFPTPCATTSAGSSAGSGDSSTS
jgi:hypothetical protein